MASNIDTTLELNKLLAQQNQLYADQAKLMKGQMVMLRQMAEMLKNLDPRILAEGWGEMTEAMQGAEAGLAGMGGAGQQSLGDMNETLDSGVESMLEMGQSLKGLGKGLMAIAGPAAIIETLGDALSIAGSVGLGLVNTMMSVASAIGNVAISIITAPFKMLSTLMNNAQGGGSGLREALEAIRKSFGDLNTGASKAIIDISRGMTGELAQTGLSTYRIFGNLAERLRTITEYATQLGSMFNNLRDSLVANGEAFGAYVKGLGLTENGLKGVGRLALSTGSTFTEVSREITTMAYGMGEAFGINGREISGAVGEMLNDVRNFGSLSVKQLSQVAVYANRLGLEFQDLQGTIDQFDNFEQAADAAAQLSQAFGLNVDALSLIQEQDPAARFEQLRKAFFQTGRSVEQMTRQEMRLLAAQTGLSEESVKLGFSLENQGVNYADIQKQGDLTQKKQLTQAEAMQKLSNSIERLVKSGGALQGGFFEIFFKGFLRGISISREFRGMMRALHQSMRATFQAGRQLGQIFVKEFPGVSDVFEGLRDIFNPSRWRAMMKQVVGAFSQFFRDITTNPQAGLQSLYKRLQEVFFNNFSAKTAAGRRVIEGFATFYKTIFRVGVAAIQLGLQFISRTISNAFTEGTTENNFVKSCMKLMERFASAIVEFPWRENFSKLKNALLDWFIESTNGIDWNVVANSVSEMLLDSLAFALRALRAVGNIILKAISDIDFGTAMQLVGAGLLAALASVLWTVLPGMLLEAGTVLVMDFLLPGILTGIEMAGSAIFTAIGGWPTLIVAALAAAGIAFLEWGDDLMNYASQALDDFGPMLAGAIEEYLPVVLEELYGFLSNLPELFVEAIEWIGSAIKSSVEWLITSVSNLFSASGNLDSALGRFFTRIGAAIGHVFADFLKNHFPNLYDGMVTFMNFFRGLRILVSKAIEPMLAWKRQHIDPIITAFRNAGTAIQATFTSVFNYISQGFRNLVDGITSMWSGISERIEPIITTIRELLNISSTPEVPGAGLFGSLRKSFQDIVSLGEQSQTAAAATTQQTTAAIAASAEAASTAVRTTSEQTNAALKATSQQAVATGAAAAEASRQGGVGASATAPAGGGGLFDGLFGGAGAPPGGEAIQRKQALEELTSLRVPSPARVARMERDIISITDRYSKGIVNNVRDLVAAVNTVTTDLNSIGDSPQRINVQLKQLANHLGVGASQRLEIRNRNFTIQMNVNVTLDADEFETALSSRPGGSTFVVRPENE